MRDDLIEEVARALHAAMSLGVWSDITDHMREHWRHQARAALDALSAHLTANGLKIVARDPATEAKRTGDDLLWNCQREKGCRQIWQAMYDAAPDVLTNKEGAE